MSFNKVERAGEYFIGTVNGEVNLTVFGERSERDFFGAGLVGGAVLSRYSDDTQTFFGHSASDG